jgi:hypothetical protein
MFNNHDKTKEIIENIYKKSIHKIIVQLFNIHLEKLSNSTEETINIIDTSANKAIIAIENSYSKLENINNQFTELTELNLQLHKEIQKRDAIIERKNKKIQRLKNAIPI